MHAGRGKVPIQLDVLKPIYLFVLTRRRASGCMLGDRRRCRRGRTPESGMRGSCRLRNLNDPNGLGCGFHRRQVTPPTPPPPRRGPPHLSPVVESHEKQSHVMSSVVDRRHSGGSSAYLARVLEWGESTHMSDLAAVLKTPLPQSMSGPLSDSAGDLFKVVRLFSTWVANIIILLPWCKWSATDLIKPFEIGLVLYLSVMLVRTSGPS
jgi:hypothetical protein